MTTIGVLEMGVLAPQELRFGDHVTRIQNYFSGQSDLSFHGFPVASTGVVPGFRACDAWVITGSAHSVYDDVPWLPAMVAFVQEAVKGGVPLLGICFGHQLMAHAMVGKVEKSTKGRGIGIHHYDLTAEGQKIFGDHREIRLMASHQDQVVVPSPNGRLLAASAFCEYAGFMYGDHALSVQGHPELTVEAERDIIERWQKADPVSQEVYETALRSLDNDQTDARTLAPIFANVLRGAKLG